MMRKLSLVFWACWVAILLVLTGCGGGGDGAEQSVSGEDSQGGGAIKSVLDLTLYVASCQEVAPCLRKIRETVEGAATCVTDNFVDFWMDCRTPCFFHFFAGGLLDFGDDESSKQEVGDGYLECLAICVDEYFIKKC